MDKPAIYTMLVVDRLRHERHILSTHFTELDFPSKTQKPPSGADVLLDTNRSYFWLEGANIVLPVLKLSDNSPLQQPAFDIAWLHSPIIANPFFEGKISMTIKTRTKT